MVRVTRAMEFSASLRHRLPDLSEEENRRRFGREAGPHGHNYRLEVSLVGEPDPITGMVMNLTELGAIMEREIVSRFDHRDLNADTSYFEKVPPTPENLALVVYRLLRDAVPDGLLDRIRLHPDVDSFVDVVGPIE